MTALANTQRLEDILDSDDPGSAKHVAEVHQLIKDGIDPLYQQGAIVSRVACIYGSSTLSWYDISTSAEFMFDATRAWNLVKAVWHIFPHSPQGIQRVYTQDARPDKQRSAAYMRALRESLQQGNPFCVALLRLMGKDFPPPIFQALLTDVRSLPAT